MAFLPIATLLFVISFLCFYFIYNEDMMWSRVGYLEAGQTFSQYCPIELLFLYRAIFALLIWSTIIFIYFDTAGLALTIIQPDGTRKIMIFKQFSRFTMFTVWSWLLQGFYFLFASYSSWIVMKASEKNAPLPSGPEVYLPSFVWVLYEVSLPISFLVTMVVTFVLIPSMAKLSLPVDNFFKPVSLIMHNANVIFMAIEFMVNGLPIHANHLVFMILYASSYVVFSWGWYRYKKIFYYFFLDYHRSDALQWHVGLLLAVSALYLIAWYSASMRLHSSSSLPNFAICFLALISLKIFDKKAVEETE